MVYEGKNTSIFVCQRCLDTTGISNGAKHYLTVSILEMLVGLYQEEMVMSGAAVFVWFPFLSFVYLALR